MRSFDARHVLYEPGQLCELLRELLRPHEGPSPAPDLDQPKAIQLLNGFPDGGPTDAIPLDQFLLRGELTPGSERPGGDRRRQVLFDLKVKRNGALRGLRSYGHYDVVMSGRQEVAISSQEIFPVASPCGCAGATPRAGQDAPDGGGGVGGQANSFAEKFKSCLQSHSQPLPGFDVTNQSVSRGGGI
jgi:hypothetical protein